MGKEKKNMISRMKDSSALSDISGPDMLYRLQYVTAALTQALTSQQIAEIIVSLGATTIHASAGIVWLLNGLDDLSIAAYTGYTKEHVSQMESLMQQGLSPARDAVRLKKPIFLHSLKERKSVYPQTFSVAQKTVKEGFIAVPLLIGDNTLGVVEFAFKKVQNFDSKEREFIFALIQQCAQALDRARLYDKEVQQKAALQHALDRVDALQRATALLSKAFTAEEMGNIVIEEAVKALGAFSGEVSVISDDRKKLLTIFYKGYPESFTTKYDPLQLDINVQKHVLMIDVIKEKKIFIFENQSQIEKKFARMQAFTKITGAHSGIIIPLFTKSIVEGVIGVFFHDEHHFHQSDIDFLVTLTQQFSQSYDRAKAYEKEKFQKERLEHLYNRLRNLQEVTKLLSSAITREEVSKIVLRQGVKAMGAMGGEIALLNEDRTKFKLLAYRGYPKEYTKSFTKEWQEISHTEPMLMWDAVKEKKSFFLTDITDLPSEYKRGKNFAKITSAKSSVTIPLIANEKSFGTFYMLFRRKILFTDEDKTYMETLAQHASQALERARIYEDQQEIAKKLRQSEENWKQLAESIPALVWAGDSDGSVYYYNRQWEEYTGVPRRAMVENEFWRRVVHPEDLSKALSLWETAVKEKKPYTLEYRLCNRFGEYKWFLSKVVPVKDKNGAIIRWFGTETDINDQKVIAQEIEKREARFRALIENSSDAIVLMDEHGKMLYSSPSTKRITGYTAEERLGKSAYDAIYPRDKAKVKEFIQNLVQSPEDKLVSIIYRRINKDGSIPWMEGIGRNMLHNPNIGALVVNYRDITERVESEKAIQQAKDELEVILENVDDAIVVRSADGHILYCNQAAARINKYNSAEEFLEDNTYRNYLARFETYFDENGREMQEYGLTISRVMHEKKPVEQILRVVFRENHLEQWRRVKSAPIIDSQGNILLIVSVVHDITEEKQKERVKDEFISMASHELKTPITSAKLYTGILQDKIRELGDEKTFTMVTKLDTQLNRLTKLINDLLDITKIRSGRITLNKERVKVQDLVHDVVEDMQYTTITHTLQLVGNSTKILLLDKERIRQVFVNLISNAIKYSPEADKVDLILQDKGDGVIICVRDFGVGIEKSEQEKIFEPFYRSESFSQNEFPGLGLGLHIAYEIVKRHGGKMWVESIPNRGTRMYVFLPIKKRDHE